MVDFDASQRRVLELDTARHARVLGAPGTGKTLMLIESYASISERTGWGEGELLLLASNRHVAARLRRAVEQRVNRAIGGTPVRTAASFAYAVLQREASQRGEAPPRLLTGTAHDEAVGAVLKQLLDGEWCGSTPVTLAPEVLMSEVFRAELRELDRVLDDFGLEPQKMAARLRRGDFSQEVGGLNDRVEQQLFALELLTRVRGSVQEHRPNEFTTSAMMRSAAETIARDDQLQPPRLVLIDDAGEVGEGSLALLSALVDRGARVWAFGDPDVATNAFQGERVRLMAGLEPQFKRRGVLPTRFDFDGEGEQFVVLEQVYRHATAIRGLVSRLTERIGAAGAGQQRRAIAASDGALATKEEGGVVAPVQFVSVASGAEQLGVIAHRMRARHLGLQGEEPQPWSEMAVVCRSRAEATRVARGLAELQVPTNIAAGGLVLREHRLVRELIRLLQHALGIAQIQSGEVLDLLGGAIGGLDPIALRRLRGALSLHERQLAATEQRAPVSIDELIFEAFMFPGEREVLDMWAARRLLRLGQLAAAGATTHRAGGTPREVLWQLWHRSGLAESLQTEALEQRGARSEEAHRALDAVLGLFFALQRHEEQDSGQAIAVLLDELLTSTVPEDSLAAHSERDVVTVTTPQSLISREFELVCVHGVQDGSWPNLRSRGSLIGVTSTERWLRGERATQPSRRDTLHDELRLFAHAVARARSEIIVLAVANEDQHPSSFFSLGRDYFVEHPPPSTRLTLRGAVAEMRRRVVKDRSDTEAVAALASLARAGVSGAHPDEWYGVQPPSTEAPLVDIEHDPDLKVTVLPSQMEQIETCPLNWLLSSLGDNDGDYRTGVGTLLHHAIERLGGHAQPEQILEIVKSEWGSLRFEAEWQAQRADRDLRQMVGSLADYFNDFEESGDALIATEAAFELPIEFAVLRGKADRLEAMVSAEGEPVVTVVDLKTGAHTPSAKQLEAHAQLQAYQLGVIRGAFVPGAVNGGAKLLYVHPDTIGVQQRRRGKNYTEISQSGLSESEQRAFEERVIHVAQIKSGAQFAAQVEHHCEDPHTIGRACALHIIPAVSHA